MVYRITSPKWANDISGNGAKLYGGRWNSVGTPMLYTSENISLAMLEILVNSAPMYLKNTFSLVVLKLPENFSAAAIDISTLHNDWNMYPPPFSTAILGDEWLNSMKSLALKVPSCTNKYEHNVLINPLHPDFKQIRIIDIKPLQFETRLFES